MLFRSASVAQKDAFNELDVEEYEIVATLDSHTSEICQELDGQHFPMKDYQAGVTAPPFHVWCRSCTVPYFDDDFSSGERAARDADGNTYYVPDNMTYKEWKKEYDDSHTRKDSKFKHDIKFATKKQSSITPRQKLKDISGVTEAREELPLKVKQEFKDITIEFGYEGSA